MSFVTRGLQWGLAGAPQGARPETLESGVIEAALRTDLRSADSSKPEVTERLLHRGLSCSAQLAPSWDYRPAEN